MVAPSVRGGFYFDKTPSWLGWTKAVSFINHAYTLLLKIQFPMGGQFPCGSEDTRDSAAWSTTPPAASTATPTDGIVQEPQPRLQMTSTWTNNSRTTAAPLAQPPVDQVYVCTVRGAGLLTFVDLEDGVGVNVGALVAMLVGMRLLAYFALRFLSLKP